MEAVTARHDDQQASIPMPVQNLSPRESDQIYTIVCYLRAQGYRVLRNGIHHNVNGSRFDDSQLIALFVAKGGVIQDG